MSNQEALDGRSALVWGSSAVHIHDLIIEDRNKDLSYARMINFWTSDPESNILINPKYCGASSILSGG